MEEILKQDTKDIMQFTRCDKLIEEIYQKNENSQFYCHSIFSDHFQSSSVGVKRFYVMDANGEESFFRYLAIKGGQERNGKSATFQKLKNGKYKQIRAKG